MNQATADMILERQERIEKMLVTLLGAQGRGVNAGGQETKKKVKERFRLAIERKFNDKYQSRQ